MDDINQELLRQAYNMWDDFKKELLYNNRFFIKHDISCISHPLLAKTLEPNTVYYFISLCLLNQFKVYFFTQK